MGLRWVAMWLTGVGMGLHSVCLMGAGLYLLVHRLSGSALLTGRLLSRTTGRRIRMIIHRSQRMQVPNLGRAGRGVVMLNAGAVDSQLSIVHSGGAGS